MKAIQLELDFRSAIAHALAEPVSKTYSIAGFKDE
jgi:hypothetical protein